MSPSNIASKNSSNFFVEKLKAKTKNPGHFGPIPHSLRLFRPNFRGQSFRPSWRGPFGPVSYLGRFGQIFGVSRFGVIYLFWENRQDNCTVPRIKEMAL